MTDKPQQYLTISEKVSLPSDPTVADILLAFENLKLKIPDLQSNETQLVDDGHWYESGDHCSELVLSVNRTIENPNYHTEMEQYHVDAALYHKNQLEWQSMHDKQLMAVVAKREYKERSHRERLVKYRESNPIQTGIMSCQ
jgi:hypothetical protein